MMETDLDGVGTRPALAGVMTQSVPSRTALATSVASARVGRGAPVMDSSIWVAVIRVVAGAVAALDHALLREEDLLEVDLHAEVTARDHDAVGLADDVVVVVEALHVLNLGDDGDVLGGAAEHLADVLDVGRPLRTKEAAMKSTLFLTPQLMMSSRSFSVMVGRSTLTPGRFMFLRSPSLAPFSHLSLNGARCPRRTRAR